MTVNITEMVRIAGTYVRCILNCGLAIDVRFMKTSRVRHFSRGNKRKDANVVENNNKNSYWKSRILRPPTPRWTRRNCHTYRASRASLCIRSLCGFHERGVSRAKPISFCLEYSEADAAARTRRAERARSRSTCKTIDHYPRVSMMTTPRNVVPSLLSLFFCLSVFFTGDNNDDEDGRGNNSNALTPRYRFPLAARGWLGERRGCFALCQARLPQASGSDGISPRERERLRGNLHLRTLAQVRQNDPDLRRFFLLFGMSRFLRRPPSSAVPLQIIYPHRMQSSIYLIPDEEYRI